MAKQGEQSPLGTEWAVIAKNIVVDSSGRLSSRKGWTKLNATPASGAIVQLHQYVSAAGATDIISTIATDIFHGTSTLTSIKGALSPSAGNWKFVNFNGYALGWQASHTPIAWNGAGNFAAITATSGTLPTGDTVLAAFGRVWGLDTDKQTIRYSALLDHTKYATVDGGGVIDMRSVWTRGMDEVVAIIAYGSSLVVFGKRHIVVWVDGSGSELGLSPVNMYVSTVIENVGLVARDAVTLVGEVDVVFWSSNGIRSLNRTVQEQASPVNELSPQNRDYLASYLATGTLSKMRAAYSLIDGFVLITHPDVSRTWCFDMRAPLESGGYRVTEWTLAPRAWCPTITDTLLLGSSDGYIGQYTGYQDNTVSYQYEFETGWVKVSGDEGRKQSLKALKGYFYTIGNIMVNFKWWVDFKPGYSTAQRFLIGLGDEWGIDEWALMEWGAGQVFHEKRIPLSHECEYAKFAVVAEINGAQFAIQPLTLYTKPTRLA